MKISDIKEKLQKRADRLKSEASALFLAFKRKETPFYAKIIVGIAVCYAFSPIDIIPDFIPIIGFLDDVLLLPLLIALAVSMIPEDVMEECRQESKDMWENKDPKRYLYAIPVIVIWVMIIALVLIVVLL